MSNKPPAPSFISRNKSSKIVKANKSEPIKSIEIYLIRAELFYIFT